MKFIISKNNKSMKLNTKINSDLETNIKQKVTIRNKTLKVESKTINILLKIIIIKPVVFRTNKSKTEHV